MKLEDLLKADPELLNKVNSLIEEHNKVAENKNKQVKFVDLSEGNYVDKDKYNNLESKFNDINSKFELLNNEHSSTKTNLDNMTKSLDELKNKYEKDLGDTKNEVKNKIIEIAIKNGISSLGVKDKLLEDGIKGNIDKTKISVDDNLNVQGLDEQLSSMKEEHKELFTGDIVKVNTATGTNTNNFGKKQYKSLEEISKLTPAEVAADRENIVEQINKLSKN